MFTCKRSFCLKHVAFCFTITLMNADFTGTPPVLTQRKTLPHAVPCWVTQGARHFITVNALCREAAPFAVPVIAQALVRNLLAYEAAGKWHLWVGVVMPDHLHFIATFERVDGLSDGVRAWKSYQAKTLKVAFQSGFFEHRLRNDDEFAEKAAYIRQNPVRRGLVAAAEEWPYLIDRFFVR